MSKKKNNIGVNLHIEGPSFLDWQLPPYANKVDWRNYHSSGVCEAFGYKLDEEGHYIPTKEFIFGSETNLTQQDPQNLDGEGNDEGEDFDYR